ncbi:hypothetical protein B0H19DRAFT_1130613 [Mycena capillaripes]|nr:hypothetical protein B0H19DRAFT_1130613 [Mycena capillaripes]
MRLAITTHFLLLALFTPALRAQQSCSKNTDCPKPLCCAEVLGAKFCGHLSKIGQFCGCGCADGLKCSAVDICVRV